MSMHPLQASEFYEEALTLATDLTSTSVSPAMWKLFEEVYNVSVRVCSAALQDLRHRMNTLVI